MADHLYSNETTQAERKAIVKNDSYFARQSNTVDDAGGRFAKLTPATITGSTPAPQYPQLPANISLASGFDVAATEPLGFSVDAMEPVGTQAEIEASIPTLNSPVVPCSSCRCRGSCRRAGTVSTPLVPTRSLNKRRSW